MLNGRIVVLSETKLREYPLAEPDFEGHSVLYVAGIPDRDTLSDASLVCCEWPVSNECGALLAEARRDARPTICVLGRPIDWEQTTLINADRVACIGRAQARQFESLGNHCEVIGLPSLDSVSRARPPVRNSPPRLLLWRVDRNQDKKLLDAVLAWSTRTDIGAKFVSHVSGPGCHVPKQELLSCDAFITNDSAALLDAMLAGIPAALVCDSTQTAAVPPAWRIPSVELIDRVIRQLFAPEPARLLFQDTTLHDTLECETPATPRWQRLVRDMIRMWSQVREAGAPMNFPARLVPRLHAAHHARETRFQLDKLFQYPSWFESDETRLRQILDTRICYARPLSTPPIALEDVQVCLLGEPSTSMVKAGSEFTVPMTVENLSYRSLLSTGPSPVNASYQWEDIDERTVVADGVRTPVDIPPHRARTVFVRIIAPWLPGEYNLVLTLVQEGQFWFRDVNRQFALRYRLMVTPVSV